MDPFSLTTGVVGLAQGLLELVKLAKELRDSIEKVSKNRQRAKGLATDTYQTVEAIHEFYAKYTSAFVEAQDLQKLVEGLRTSLTEIVEKCKAMDPEPEKGRLRRGVAGFRAWLKRDELEARLTDLNIRAQQCQIKFMTLATLSVNVIAHEIRATTTRMDTNISSIHQRVIVRRISKDSPGRERLQLRHVDPVVPGTSVAILESPDPQLEDDVVKHAFLGLQVKEIHKFISSLLQDPNISFHIPPSQPDDPTHVCVSSQLYISWEIVQRHAALESAQLIDTIHNADSSTSVEGVSAALTDLSHRYKHLGMCREALTLSALALQLGRLAVKAYPDSDRLQGFLAIDLENYASVLLVCGESTVEATQCMIEAVSIQRRLVAKFPLPGRKVSLAHCLSESSCLAIRAGDLETAESDSVEALEIILCVMGARPGTVPAIDTFRLMGWTGVERNGVLTVDEKWQDQAIFLYPDILDTRFRCALARKSFSDAYRYATGSRKAYQVFTNRYPQKDLVNLLYITTELLNEWADPLRSEPHTITLCTNAISYLSAIPTRQGYSDDGDSLFRKYTLQAKLSTHLQKTANALGAVEAQQTASLYWDHYHSTYPEMARKQISSLFEAQHAVDTLYGQVQLYYAGHLPRLPASTSLVVDFRQFSAARISEHPTLRISHQTYQSIHQQAKTVELWFRDVHPAGPSPELGGPDTRESLMYGQFNAVLAFCFAHLGELDAAHQAARRAIDTIGGVVPQHSLPPSKDGGKTWWDMAAWVVNIAAWVSEACIATSNDPRSLACSQDVVALVKSLFPTQESICIPSAIDATGILDNIGAVLTTYCRHLEILQQTDESLSISKNNLDWYTARLPSSYPTNRDHRHIALILDLVRNLIHAGQWSTALTHTTTVFDAIVSNPTLRGTSSMKYTIDWWTLALLIHCSILTELGRVEVAAKCITQGIEALTNVDSCDECSWKGPTMVRKAFITSLLGQEDQMEYTRNYAPPDFQSIYGGQIAYYLLAPARVHSGSYLDASHTFGDVGDHQQATKHAQEALSSIAALTTESFNKWQEVALVQQRTDSVIAHAVAFILGGHFQDAAELFPPLFDIYKKELQYQRNLYPGYAVALRLAGWVFDKVGNVAEARRMKRQEAGLEYLFDEEADEETLRVIRIRLEMEERRPAIRRVREILGVGPYEAKTSD